jgi:hypothetical protein
MIAKTVRRLELTLNTTEIKDLQTMLNRTNEVPLVGSEPRTLRNILCVLRGDDMSESE